MHVITNLSNLFVNEPSILFIALIGNRASAKASLDGDWDFAIQSDYSMDVFKQGAIHHRISAHVVQRRFQEFLGF